MRRWCVGIALAGASLLTACGGATAPMNGDAAAQLRDRMTAVRSAVVARDTDGAARALDDLRRAVGRLRRTDALSDERAADILAAAGSVEDELVTITTTTSTTTTTTTTLPRAPVTKPGKAPAPDNGKGNDKRDDKGKGAKGPH